MNQHSTGAAARQIRAGGHVVGHVADGVFYKTVRASVHFLRTPRAICFDVASLHDAERLGARYVAITDSESGQVYRAAMGTIWKLGRPLNRGFGEQWRLDLCYWNTGAEPAAEQLPLALFGERA
jgi:hypothetical protein